MFHFILFYYRLVPCYLSGNYPKWNMFWFIQQLVGIWLTIPHRDGDTYWIGLNSLVVNRVLFSLPSHCQTPYYETWNLVSSFLRKEANNNSNIEKRIIVLRDDLIFCGFIVQIFIIFSLRILYIILFISFLLYFLSSASFLELTLLYSLLFDSIRPIFTMSNRKLKQNNKFLKIILQFSSR